MPKLIGRRATMSAPRGIAGQAQGLVHGAAIGMAAFSSK